MELETWGCPGFGGLAWGCRGPGICSLAPPRPGSARPSWEIWGSTSLTCPRLPGWALCQRNPWGLGPWRPPAPISPSGGRAGGAAGRYPTRGSSAGWPGVVCSLSGDSCPPCPRGPRRPARSSQCHTHWRHARCGSGPSRPKLGPTSWQPSGNEEEP